MNFNFLKYIITSEKIIIHQLNNIKLILFILIFYQRAFDKITWVIWGGDLYFYKNNGRSIYYSVIELVRKLFIPKVKIISCYIYGDYEVCKEVYKFNPQYKRSLYPGTIDFEFIERFHNIKSENQINTYKILIGNSADPLNYHIDAFYKLAKFATENIAIYVVLSYGGSENYIEEVKKIGKKIFDSKIHFIENFMDKVSYFSFLRDIDICVFNHEHQQGLGNLNLLLSIYKKVYIRSCTTPFEFFNKLGIKIYDTDSILNLTFKELIEYDNKEMVENKRQMMHLVDPQICLTEWRNIL